MATFKLLTGQTVIVNKSDLRRVLALTWHYCNGYAKHSYRENGKVRSMYLHQFLFPGFPQIDHKNLNRLDNRRSNLRRSSSRLNAMNRGKSPGSHSSKFKGVYFHKETGKWMARIGDAGKHYLGLHPTETVAAKAYNAAAWEIYGEHAVLNSV